MGSPEPCHCPELFDAICGALRHVGRIRIACGNRRRAADGQRRAAAEADAEAVRAADSLVARLSDDLERHQPDAVAAALEQAHQFNNCYECRKGKP